MQISIIQATLLGICACLSSMPGMGGTTIGNYTLGRPLVGGLLCGLILGDLSLGVTVGAAIQVVYIALITPGGAVAADTRAISYIGIPLAMVAIHSAGVDPQSAQATQMATALGAAVGTLGTVLYYGTCTINLVWQHMGLKAIDEMKFKKLYMIDMGLPWLSHAVTSFIPCFLMTLMGKTMVDTIITYLPMDGIAMKTLFTVGSMLPAVGVALLLKQVVEQMTDLITFFFGFTLAAVMGVNLVGATIIGGFFAIINYRIKMVAIQKPVAANNIDFDEEEDI